MKFEEFFAGRTSMVEVVPKTPEILTLHDCGDARNFYPGQVVVLDRSGERLTGPRLLTHEIWRKLTAPFRRRVVVTEVDVWNGAVSVTGEKRWYRFL